ncbi:MAG: ribbon-helix-helix domain-containing protein [Coriobacteriia bacterium]
MGRMVRKQIVMEPEQEAALEKAAAELGISQSELIRRAIDEMLASAELARERRRQGMREFLRLADEAVARGEGSYGATWTREELHERGND